MKKKKKKKNENVSSEFPVMEHLTWLNYFQWLEIRTFLILSLKIEVCPCGSIKIRRANAGRAVLHRVL